MTDKITMAGDTQAEIAAMRAGADALGRIAASLWGDTAKAHKKAQSAILTAAADRMEREAGLPTRDELAAAIINVVGIGQPCLDNLDIEQLRALLTRTGAA